jgi:hypothetical protein
MMQKNKAVITQIDCTDPKQVFDRLAQLQHETQARLDQINALCQKQIESDSEFDYLELITHAYLRNLDYPVALGVAYDTVGTSLRRSHQYALSVTSKHVVIKPVVEMFKIPGLTLEEIAEATSPPPLTTSQEIEAAAHQAAIDLLDDLDPNPDVIEESLEATWDLPKDLSIAGATFDNSEVA